MQAGRASTIQVLPDGRLLRTGGVPEREAALMALARHGGIAVPRIDEVRTDALVMERIHGPTMAGDLRRRPWRAWRHMATLARLHREMHAIDHDGATLVHYDLHPENVMLGPDGPVLIDWTNARAGDPDADVALTWLILETSAGLPGRLLGWMFARHAGRVTVRRGLQAAREFRAADRNVTAAERERALAARI